MGMAVAHYLNWRAEMIEWDTESIQEMFGGPAEEDHILQVKFVKEWEYKALKKTQDGRGVWLHLSLSKRYCGNWMFVDQSQRNLIRPIHLRYPDGLPQRLGGVPCSGVVPESAKP
jgi:hypothetical protein